MLIIVTGILKGHDVWRTCTFCILLVPLILTGVIYMDQIIQKRIQRPPLTPKMSSHCFIRIGKQFSLTEKYRTLDKNLLNKRKTTYSTVLVQDICDFYFKYLFRLFMHVHMTLITSTIDCAFQMCICHFYYKILSRIHARYDIGPGF